VLVATPFEGEEEAIRLANATQYGLAAYVWTNDIKRAHRVAHAIDTGMYGSTRRTCATCARGGVKASGIGREGGDDAFEFYCDVEVVPVALSSHAIPKLATSRRTRGIDPSCRPPSPSCSRPGRPTSASTCSPPPGLAYL
jgi:5-carboxymethyl-2-hydroxymuconic-semialdehyde dehydrogenase